MKYTIQQTTAAGGVGLPNLSSMFKVLGWKKGDEVEIEIISRDEIIIRKIES